MRRFISLSLWLLPVGLLLLLGCSRQESFTDISVAARFTRGAITVDQVVDYIRKIGPKCHNKVAGCPMHPDQGSGCQSDKPCSDSDTMDHAGSMSKAGSTSKTNSTSKVAADTSGSDKGGCCGGEHGGEHAGCCGGSQTALLEKPCGEHENCCMQHYDLKKEDYQQVVEALVFEQMLRDYIEEKGLAHQPDTQELMKYITDDVYITDTHVEMQKSMQPTETEIREYYEAHRGDFGIRTLNEVRDDITSHLKREMHEQYMPRYIKELKRNALIRKDPELLQPSPPDENEVRQFYRQHRKRYEQPERFKFRQIVTSTREQAEQAQSRLRARERFEDVTDTYSTSSTRERTLPRESLSEDTRPYLLGLGVEEITPIVEENGHYLIMQLVERQEAAVQPFDEVRDAIYTELMRQREQELSAENSQRTLFSVNYEDTSVETFERLYQNLPPEQQREFSSPDGKAKLIDRIIEHALLAQDAYARKVVSEAYQSKVEDLRTAILKGTLYEQEILGHVTFADVSDAEVEKYYKQHQQEFLKPGRARISYLRIKVGKDQKLAMEKAREAYDMAMTGVDFGEVVRKYSDDDWTASKDGRIDEYLLFEEEGQPIQSPTEIQMHAFHEQVFKIMPGEITHPFEFMGSYFIVKLHTKQDSDYLPLEQAQDSIRQFLLTRKRRDKTDDLKQKLMEESHLVINEDAIKQLQKHLIVRKEDTLSG